MQYWTSDLHLGHANIIRYCSRPWLDGGEPDLDSMLRAMRNMMAPVQHDDDVWVIGDVAWRLEYVRAWRHGLPGRFHLIYGNHDHKRTALSQEFMTATSINVTKIGRHNVVMKHIPTDDWEGRGAGSLLLHGHLHTINPPTPTPITRMLDVGVDGRVDGLHEPYTLWTEAQIIRYFGLEP